MEKRPVGRPRLFSSPEEFEQRVYDYQQHCIESKEPVTWTGLALFLGLSTRQSIDNYLEYPEFVDSVKRAKTFVEWNYEMRLCGDKPTGAIFALKNMGWSDKQELAHTSPDGTMSPTRTQDLTDEELAAEMERHGIKP